MRSPSKFFKEGSFIKEQYILGGAFIPNGEQRRFIWRITKEDIQ
jgi:hypothetical protein